MEKNKNKVKIIKLKITIRKGITS